MDDQTTGGPPDETAASAGGTAADSGGTAADSGETAETTVTPSDGGETLVAPPDEAGATRVLSGESADATRVMPAPGTTAPTPPTPLPQPTLMLSRSPRGRSNAWWIVLVVVLLALVAAAAGWYFLLRDTGDEPAPQPSPAFDWVGAWGRTDGGGGGVVVEESGQGYMVTVYGSALQVVGTAIAAPAGKDLVFDLESEEMVGGLPGPFRIVLQAGANEDAASMKIVGASKTTVIIPLQRVVALVPVAPAPTPTPTPTPTPLPSTSPSASPTSGTEQQAVIDAIGKLQAGVTTWATNNNNLFPTPADVTQTGTVAVYVNPWPTNPYTGQPMKQGTEPGDYVYEQLDGGTGYKLTGFIQDGLSYTVP